jgi:L-ascorbate metabolism protein UlaG (beta-lactamase superfamily)
VLLSHDHHADNLDDLGRVVLSKADTVLTTTAAARRLGRRAVGLAPWSATVLEQPGRPTIHVTATPCRHGPPGSRRIVGDVIGFALRWDGQRHGEVWISGDTVIYDGVRQVADRRDIGTAIIHLGGVRFPITGPLRYTMTAGHAVDLLTALRPTTIVPVHYEGWSHFQEPRPDIERAFSTGPHPIGQLVRWAPPGAAVSIET